MVCPVCGKTFKAKIVKSAKARQIAMDDDLRPKFEGVDTLKYDVLLCTKCGYEKRENLVDPLGHKFVLPLFLQRLS